MEWENWGMEGDHDQDHDQDQDCRDGQELGMGEREKGREWWNDGIGEWGIGELGNWGMVGDHDQDHDQDQDCRYGQELGKGGKVKKAEG